MRIEGSIARTDVNEVLAQMRALKAAAQAHVEPDRALTSQSLTDIGASTQQNVGAPSALESFGAHLQSALQSVNSLQGDATRLQEGFAAGRHQDLVSTMVATQKATVAFQAATQVRNRLVTAYESIMNMPI